MPEIVDHSILILILLQVSGIYILISSENIAADRASDISGTQKTWVQFPKAISCIEESSRSKADDSF